MGGFYNGLNYTQCDSLADLFDVVLSEKNIGRIIFAHNGGRFDFLFLMEYLRGVRNIEAKLIAQGPRITALKIAIGKRKYVTLQDSYSLLPASLEKLSDTFKPETGKAAGSIDFERERVSKDNPEHREYLRRDCVSLWEIIDKYRQLPYVRDVGLKMTLASTSLAAWRTTMKKPIRVTSKSVQEFVRGSYAGGRCEIFRQVMSAGACYDVNSLYPTAMLNKLPVEYIGDSSDVLDFGFHDVTVRVPDCYMPILWCKTPKLIFPTGTFRGTYFSEELRLAIENGAIVERHHRGVRFSAEADLFSDFIADCYKMRMENKGTALDFIGKMLMNNTYGKFAEREEKKSLIKINQVDPSSWPPEFSHWHSEKMFRDTGIVEIIKNKRSPHMLCHIASAITAYARIKMARELYLPRQDSIYYTDTDSGFISGNINNSELLGEFKEEYLIKNAFFLLPKGYYIETQDGKIIKKLKGFSKKSLESISYDLFIKGNIKSTEIKLAGFRSALIRKNTFLSLLENKKSVISEYNKRKILPGGETRPWNIKQGVLR